MSEASLALNILLKDSASPGLAALGLSLGNLTYISRGLGDFWKSLSPTMQGMGIAALTTGVSFGLLAGFVKSTVDAAAGLESEMALVQNSVQGASEANDAMKQTLIHLADQSIYSTQEIANGFAMMGIDGYNAQQIMSGMGQQGTVLAEALNSDTTPAFNLLGTSMELFGADASDAAQYTQDLVFMFYNGEKSIANIQQALALVGPTAHQLNIPFGELSDVLALLAQDGLKGSQGAASLNYWLTALSAPIAKQQHALAALGLLVVNTDVPAFVQLQQSLRAAGDAAMANHYDGTVHSLNEMFDAAKKIGAIKTDLTFMEWADKVGILKNAMYDANGQFIGLTNSILVLGNALKGMTEQQKADFIGQLFNVRSGRVARDLLTDIENQLSRLGSLDAIRQATDPAEKASRNLNTLNNAIKQLGTNFQDFKARLGEADLGPLKGLAQGVSSLMDKFNTASPQVHTMGTTVLLATTAFLGMAAAVTTAVFVGGLLAGTFAIALPIIAALGVMFLQVGAAAGVIAWAFGQAQTKGSQFGAVVRPIFDLVGAAFSTVKSEIVGQLLPALGNLGLNMDHLKVIGIVLLAAFVAPIIIGLGILIGTVVVVTTVVTKLAQIFVWTRDTLGALKDGTVAFISLLVGTVVNGFNTVRNIVGGVFSFIGSLFPWLYAHNYYVAALVDTIHVQLTRAGQVVHAIVTGIQVAWSVLWDNTVGRAVLAWNTITNLFNMGKGRVDGAMTNIKNTITTIVGSLVGQMLSFGQNLITMFIQGITSKLGQLRDVVGNIAHAIAAQLGFHSPPAEGPLRDSDSYMPNMMRMFATGTSNNAHLVHNAANAVATGLRPGGMFLPGAAFAGAGSVSSGSRGESHFHVHVGSREVAHVVVDEITGTLKQNGAGRLFR
jgi:hypothetical protein